MFIDTHCHLSSDDYDNIDDVIKRANKNNIKYLIVSGCDKKGIKEAIELSKRYKNIYITLGYHPSEVDTTTDEDLKMLKEIIKNNDKVIGIGEVGLDYHYTKDNKDKQILLFSKQIEIAKELNLPLIIHSRDAFQDTYDILKKSNHKGVIHCFSGNKENAKMYFEIGFYFGIGGVLTFNNSNLKDTIKDIPLNRLLLETDSPYLSPVPHRGEKNEPANILLIAEKLASVLGKNISEISEITIDNTRKIFNNKFD